MKGGLFEVTETLDSGPFWDFGQGARPLARIPLGANWGQLLSPDVSSLQRHQPYQLWT